MVKGNKVSEFKPVCRMIPLSNPPNILAYTVDVDSNVDVLGVKNYEGEWMSFHEFLADSYPYNMMTCLNKGNNWEEPALRMLKNEYVWLLNDICNYENRRVLCHDLIPPTIKNVYEEPLTLDDDLRRFLRLK